MCTGTSDAMNTARGLKLSKDKTTGPAAEPERKRQPLLPDRFLPKPGASARFSSKRFHIETMAGRAFRLLFSRTPLPARVTR